METMRNASRSFSCSVMSTLTNPIHHGSWFCSSGVIRMTVWCSTTTHSAPPRFASKGCKLVGCGSAVPKFKISNDDLAKLVDTSDEWISVRTGIHNRHVITGNESITSLATEAAKKALEMAKVEVDDVDLILLCSSTPDDLGGGAPQIQKSLGCKHNPPAYDIRAGCSGFTLGLASAFCYIRGGGFENVLVIGADVLSRYINWTEKEVCVLFGDAAGAVLLQACDIEEDGLFGTDLHTDGNGQKYIHATIKEDETYYDEALRQNSLALGFSPKRASLPDFYMNGKQVFKFAVTKVPQSIELALQDAGIQQSTVDWLLLHQANQRIIDAVAERLAFPPERVITNIENYGNTSAASIPLALDESVRSGKVKPGHTIASAGYGSGLTWGSIIFRWK